MDHSVLHARISLRKHLCFVSVSWWKFIEKCSSANEMKWGKSYFVVLLCTVAKSCEIPCKQRWYKHIQRFSAHTVSALCPATTSNTLIQLRKTPNSLKSHAFIISLNDFNKDLYRVSAFCWVCFQKSKVCNKINSSLYFLVRKHIIDAVPSSICGVKIRGLSNYPFSKTGQANQKHLRPRPHWSAAGPPRISQASEHNVRGLHTEMMGPPLFFHGFEPFIGERNAQIIWVWVWLILLPHCLFHCFHCWKRVAPPGVWGLSMLSLNCFSQLPERVLLLSIFSPNIIMEMLLYKTSCNSRQIAALGRLWSTEAAQRNLLDVIHR